MEPKYNTSVPTTKPLNTKTIGEAIDDALWLIEEERSGRINGLYTRFKGINRAKMKYWRFRSVTCLSGMSGSGKSAILNMLENDFTDINLNPTFLAKSDGKGGFEKDDRGRLIPDPKIILLAFKYEMEAADEVIRTLSGEVEKSYAYLLSGDVQGTDDKGNYKYNTISDEEYNTYKDKLEERKNRPILYVENAGNLNELKATALKVKNDNPGKKLIITIDHTLLSKKLAEKDDLELMSNTAKLGIELRKELNALVIFLSQMNGEIEKTPRRTNNDLHFPVKTDMHAQNQIFWACDDVMIFHKPEILNITRYGNINIGGVYCSLKAKNLIHCAWIKGRKNTTGHIFFRAEFEKGRIVQVEAQEVIYKEDTIPM